MISVSWEFICVIYIRYRTVGVVTGLQGVTPRKWV